MAGLGNKNLEIASLVQSLRDYNPRSKIKAAYTLGTLGEAAVNPLIAALGDEDVSVRWNAAFALRNIGRAAVEPLIHCLEKGNPSVRAPACWALGMIGDIRAVPHLIQALQDESESVRRAATEALRKVRNRGSNPSKAAIPPLES